MSIYSLNQDECEEYLAAYALNFIPENGIALSMQECSRLVQACLEKYNRNNVMKLNSNYFSLENVILLVYNIHIKQFYQDNIFMKVS